MKGPEGFIRDAREDSRVAKVIVMQFIEAQKQRIESGAIGPTHLKGSLKPIRLDFGSTVLSMSSRRVWL